MSFKLIIDEMEDAAGAFRTSLGYNDNDFIISFNELLERVNRIENLIIKQYDSPLKPMVAFTDTGFKIILSNNSDERTNKEQLLHEMAHILFGDEMPKYCGDQDKISEERADLFVRCFLMPKRQFMNAVIENSNSNEIVNINEIARVFNVNTYMVLKRGEELLGWR